jgi:hypothetical protein
MKEEVARNKILRCTNKAVIIHLINIVAEA